MLRIQHSASPGAFVLRSLVFLGAALIAPILFAQAPVRSTGMPNVIPSTQRQFAIPFEIRTDHATDSAKEIELLVSRNGGVGWHVNNRLPLEAKSFTFQAEADGEYWFAFRTVSLSGVIRPSGGGGPQLRVLVDTVSPEISVIMEQQSGGEMLVSWKVTEKNFQGKKPTFAVSALSAFEAAKNWIPLTVDSKHLRQSGDTLEGRFLFWPYIPGSGPSGPGEIELRMTAEDTAGNQSETSCVARITPVGSHPASIVGNIPSKKDGEESEHGTNGTAGPITPPRPLRVRRALRDNSAPVSLEPILQKPELAKNGDDPFTDWNFSETLADLERPEAMPERLTEKAVAVSMEESDDLAQLLLARMDGLFDGRFAQERAALAEKKADEINESQRAFSWENGPVFPEAPELPALASIPVETPKPVSAEPYAVVASAVATESRETSETESNQNIMIPATGQIVGISLNTATSPAQIIVKWNVGSEIDQSGLIDVLRSASPEGPWRPIARSLANSGEYWWYLSKIDLEPFYINVEFSGAGGKRHSDQTGSPIHVDPAWLATADGDGE